MDQFVRSNTDSLHLTLHLNKSTIKTQVCQELKTREYFQLGFLSH